MRTGFGIVRLGLLPVACVVGLVTPASAAPAEVRPLAPGDTLPELRGDLLDGREIVLPDAVRGSRVILLLGFSYASRFDVEAWAERIRERLGDDSALVTYEVPVIGGMARMARPFIDRGMRRGTPEALHDRVFTVYRDAGTWKRLAGHDAKDVAYVLLLDPDGRIAWRGNGPLDEAAFAALARAVRDGAATAIPQSTGTAPDAGG